MRLKELLVSLAIFNTIFVIFCFTILSMTSPSKPSVQVFSSVKAALNHVFMLAMWNSLSEPLKRFISPRDCLSSSIESLMFTMQSLMVAASICVKPFCFNSFDTMDDALCTAFRVTERETLRSFWGFALILKA